MGKYLFQHRKLLIGIFALGVFFLYFHYLGAYHLIDPDEGRYHEIPREMLITGDFVTPRLNGVEYFEKPVLQYWITAFFMYIFGINEWAGRIFPALAAVGTIGLTGLLASKMYTWRVGLLSAGILATSAITVVIGGMNILDMGITLWLTLTMVAYYYYKQNYARRYIYLLYVAMALGLLQKGLIAIVLPGGIILFDILYQRNWRMLKEIFYFPAIVLGLIVAVPWFYFVAKANSDFMYFFFVHEHYLRFVTKVHHRFQPWWFFIPFIFLGLTPWAGYLAALFSKEGIIRRAENKEEKAKVVFLLLWFAIIFVFFSISDSKLVPYIMPCFIPLSVLIAASMRRCDQLGRWLGNGLWLNCLWSVVFAIALMVVEFHYKEASGGDLKQRIYPLLLLVAVLPVVLYLANKYFQRVRCVMTTTFIMGCLIVMAVQYLQVGMYNKESSYYVSQKIISLKQQPDLIVNYGDYFHGMVFYTGRRVALADFKGELEFGSTHPGAKGYFFDNQELADLWKSNNRIIIVVKANDLARCKRVIATAPKYEAQVQDYYILSNKVED